MRNGWFSQIRTARESTERPFGVGFISHLQIARRSDGLRAALVDRLLDELLLNSLRVLYSEQIASEDTDLLRQWIAVIATTSSVVKAVLGGIH